MSNLQSLLAHCFAGRETSVIALAQQQTALWHDWLLPLSSSHPVGDDPGYDHDFQSMRDEVNKLSGANTDLIGELAERLLTLRSKDLRVAAYYVWGRLHRDGEKGLAEGLMLMAGLLERYGHALLPQRAISKKSAIEWLAGRRMLDSLSLYPDVNPVNFERVVMALALIKQVTDSWNQEERPDLSALYQAIDSRIPTASRGVRLQTSEGDNPYSDLSAPSSLHSASGLKKPHSGRELLEQARAMAGYLLEQPHGWLAAHRCIKSLRWDTVHNLPPANAEGNTRLSPPRTEYLELLSRLAIKQSWREILEKAEEIFSQGANHFWLDIQFHVCQALQHCGPPYAGWVNVVQQDLCLLLERLQNLEKLAYAGGMAFASEQTLDWIHSLTAKKLVQWQPAIGSGNSLPDSDVLLLHDEALAKADAEGLDIALLWLQCQPTITTFRQRWLLRLLMSRVAEVHGNEALALYLLHALNAEAQNFNLPQWEPNLCFETQVRELRLLRLKTQRNGADKAELNLRIDTLQAELVTLDPARAAAFCE